jgi:hypothetical protein
VINTTEEKILLESDEPAFMVLGSTSYEEPGHAPDVKKKVTVFTLRINEAMADKLNELTAKFHKAKPHDVYETVALDALIGFRQDICERVCSRHADLTRINDELAVIVWRRVELKGGKRK